MSCVPQANKEVEGKVVLTQTSVTEDYTIQANEADQSLSSIELDTREKARLDKLFKFDHHDEGRPEYGFSFISGWMDITQAGEQFISFRQIVSIEEMIHKIGFSEIEVTPMHGSLSSFKERQFVKDGIVVRVVDDLLRTEKTWISYVEITSPDYKISDQVFVGMTNEEFLDCTSIDVLNEELILTYLDSVDLNFFYDYAVDGIRSDLLESSVKIIFRERVIVKIIFYIEEGHFYP